MQTTKTIAVLVLAAVVLAAIGGCKSKDAAKQDKPDAGPKAFKNEVYRAIDDTEVVTIISPTELELKKGNENLICEYTRQDNGIRVVLTVLGTKQAVYLTTVADGLKHDVQILYDTEHYQAAKSLIKANELLAKAETTTNTSEREEYYRQAKDLYQKAADAGDSDAMCNLGVCYHNGWGVAKDDQQAVKWYQKAADTGNSGAMSNLGNGYHNGWGVVQDDQQAVKWYQKAADAGSPYAMFCLGHSYFEGRGVVKDDHQAIQWFNNAAMLGSDPAKAWLAEHKLTSTQAVVTQPKNIESNKSTPSVTPATVAVVLAEIGGCKPKGSSPSSQPAKELTLDLGNNASMKLVLIPAGKFMMGSPDSEKGREKHEGPQREVTISKPFYMGVYEVTRAQYAQFVKESGQKQAGVVPDNCPASNMDWDDAMAFCKWLSKKTGKMVQLPTEAQWEYACRAGTATRFSFGDDERSLSDYAWFGEWGQTETPPHPVGQKKPNAWGLYDMYGNVSEWCADWYGDRYSNANETDPTGPASGPHHVQRGASQLTGSAWCRSAARGPFGTFFENEFNGFRVVVDPAGDKSLPEGRMAVDVLSQARQMAATEQEKAKIDILLGTVYQGLNDFKKAEQMYLDSLKVLGDENAPQSLNNLAYMYANDMHNPAEGVKYAVRALKILPNDIDVLDTYGWAMVKAGQLNQAAEDALTRAVAGDKSPFVCRYHLGYLYEKTNRREEAKTQYKASLDMAPSDDPIRKTIQEGYDRVNGDVKPPKELTLDLGNKVTMKFVLIPSGKFEMGSTVIETDRAANEGPQHEVTIRKPFYMGIYEVTQEQYERIMGNNPSNFNGAQNPVENVSWKDAAEFCKKLSQNTGKTVRLPTEAEWEYACRAGSTTRFCYGDDNDYSKLGDYAWYDKNSDNKTHPVGQKKPNDWGLYDMHGNVWQWCSDWYADSYANANNTDPQGPGSGTHRVLRGGSWYNGPRSCRSADRNRFTPDIRFFSLGFRVSVDLK